MDGYNELYQVVKQVASYKDPVSINDERVSPFLFLFMFHFVLSHLIRMQSSDLS